MGTLPGWNRKKGLLGNHFLAILQKHGKKICYNTRRINVTLTMPTALLRWDPDLQPGNRSSDDAAGGSVLQSGDQHKMLLSFNQIAALSTIEKKFFSYSEPKILESCKSPVPSDILLTFWKVEPFLTDSCTLLFDTTGRRKTQQNVIVRWW